MFAEVSPILQLIMEDKSKIIELDLSSLKRNTLSFPEVPQTEVFSN
jgi:hypothetical protein